MAFFTESFISRLYVAADSAGSSRGFVAFLIPPTGTLPDQAPELADALTNTTYQGTFIFSAGTPALPDAPAAQAFYDAINALLPPATRSMLWVHNIENYNVANTPRQFSIDAMQLSEDGSAVVTALAANLIPKSLVLNVTNGLDLQLTGTVLRFVPPYPGTPAVTFSGGLSLAMNVVPQAEVDFAGSLRGCIYFRAQITRGSVMTNPSAPANGLPLGVRFTYLDATTDYRTGFFPLAQAGSDADNYLLFEASIDPTDAFNTAFAPAASATLADAYGSRRTYFNFAPPTTQFPAAIASFYTTTHGASLTLLPVTTVAAPALPARLVLGAGLGPGDYYLTPEGDFAIQINSPAGANDHCLLGGMQGTEFFQVTAQTDNTPGDQLRFMSGQPALAPLFPLPAASPVGPPAAAGAALLTAACTTSWATLLPASGNPLYYVAQPKGAALFGTDTLLAPAYDGLFGHVAPGFAFVPDPTTTFPLIPYAQAFVDQGHPTWFSQAQMTDFENLIVSSTRRTLVGRLTPTAPRPRQQATEAAGATITTPTGLLVTLPPTGDQMQWQQVLLGQNTDDQAYQLAFANPGPELVAALQTSDLLLVVANATYLDDSSSGATFEKLMSIGGWGFNVDVGQDQAYGDYRNIILIKGRHGKLYDADSPDNSLAADYAKWTQAEKFAAPTTDGSNGQPDTSQLANLAQWLHDYFKQAVAADQADPGGYFSKFSALAQNENWTGILFLRVALPAGKLPGSLAGIVAGVTDASAFNAHHLAIEISPIKKSGTDAVPPTRSTMSGLIYYVDPAFTDALPYTTLPPATSGDYDFRLLTLKVLFENTAVQRFESYAQLTLGRLFGAAVTGTGDPNNVYNNLLLTGSLQLNGGNPVYNLGTNAASYFELDSNIIRRVQLTSALLTTRVPDDATQAAFWFGLRGFVDFYALANADSAASGPASADSDQPFDLFSFGVDEATGLGQGLAFSNLGISMTYPVATPTDRTLSFDVSELQFDLSLSTPRAASLFTSFALDEVVLLSGPDQASLDALGYLPVVPDLRLAGVDGPWYGLKFLLRLGTPGELAGKASLNAYLLLAWDAASAGNDYRASVQLALPGTSGGASLISLQNVLKLSIGQIRLAFVPPADPATGKSSFLLLFTEVALKFLGLLKIPPAGSLLFYLFGNPNAAAKPSGLGWYAMYKKNKPKALRAG